jgi:hypothetical protein
LPTPVGLCGRVLVDGPGVGCAGSVDLADQVGPVRLPAAFRALRATPAFSPREAWKIEIDFDSDRGRSKNNGLCRVWQVGRLGNRV